jgi:hypothetical protein
MIATPDETIRFCRLCCQRLGQPHLLTCASETETLEERVALLEEGFTQLAELAELAQTQVEIVALLLSR